MIEPYYQSDRVTLYNADCLEVLRHLPAGSVDAVVTDPPYGVGLKQQATKHRVRKCSYATYNDDEAETIKLVNAVVPELVRVAGRVILTPGTRIIQAYPKAEDIGTVFMPGGVGLGRWGFNGNNPLLYYGKCPFLARGLGARPNSVSATHWNRRKDAEHPCEKPVEWMVWMVKRVTVDDDESILDPFMGSGTTGVAAINTGRKFIGIELDAGYCEIAKKRIQEAEAKQEVPAK